MIYFNHTHPHVLGFVRLQ